MSDTDASEPAGDAAAPGRPAAALSAADEIAVRRYEARLGVWKVILGTGIVGLAGVLIPGAVSLYTAVAEDYRQSQVQTLAEETSQQQYIKDFFDTAINQDIELRIRFAEYFANLAGDGQRELWQNYLAALVKQRDDARGRIRTFQAEVVTAMRDGNDVKDPVKYDEALLQLQWANSEVGYSPIQIGTIAPASKKQALYQETVSVIQRLAALQEKPDETSPDYLRFWELYNRDLIGVESPNFEVAMVRIGGLLKQLVANSTAPTEDFRSLATAIASLSTNELTLDSGGPMDAATKAVADELVRRLWTPAPAPASK